MRPYCDATGAFQYRYGTVQQNGNFGPNAGPFFLVDALDLVPAASNGGARTCPWFTVNNLGGTTLTVEIRAVVNIAVLPGEVATQYLRDLVRYDAQGPLLTPQLIRGLSSGALEGNTVNIERARKTSDLRAITNLGKSPTCNASIAAGAAKALVATKDVDSTEGSAAVIGPVPPADTAKHVESAVHAATTTKQVASAPANVEKRPSASHVHTPSTIAQTAQAIGGGILDKVVGTATSAVEDVAKSAPDILTSVLSGLAAGI
jgi:hypothetical protein